jgi:glycosyltransferase involved in cell wall biosynthesis
MFVSLQKHPHEKEHMAQAKTKKILIIHPEGNINNNPNLTGIVEILCENNYTVHIYSLKRHGIYQQTPCPGSRLFLVESVNTSFTENFLLLNNHTVEKGENLAFHINKKISHYDLIIGIDRGIIEAAVIATAKQIPYGLISYEIFFENEAGQKFKAPEQKACRNLAFAVCQDAVRARCLSEENHIALEKIIKIPVAGRFVKKGEKSYYLYDELCIDKQKKIALHIGSTGQWTMTDELINSAKNWSKDWALVIHSRYGLDLQTKSYYEKYKEQDNLYFSLTPTPHTSQMGKILHSADVGIALYQPVENNIWAGNNIKYVGMSSGKIATYLQHGLPVIVNDIGVMSDYVKNEGLGKVIDNSKHMDITCTQMDLAEWQTNGLNFFKAELDLNVTATELISTISQLTNDPASSAHHTGENNNENHFKKQRIARLEKEIEALAKTITRSEDLNPCRQISVQQPQPLSNRSFLKACANLKDSGCCSIDKKGNELPHICVITPSFNQGRYLEACIDSVLSQNYPNLEYIIMDGGSTDNSVEIIKKYEKHLTYWQSISDGGHYAAINDGFKKTTGQIMTWLNSDDTFHPNAFKIAGLIFKYRDDIQWIMGRPNTYNEQGSQLWINDRLPIWSREMYLIKQFKYIQQEGTFWRRSLWNTAGGCLDTNIALAGDLELWVRFFRHAQLFTVDALLAGFRTHSGQKSQAFRTQYISEAEHILDQEIQQFKKGLHKNLLPGPDPILRTEITTYHAMEFGEKQPPVPRFSDGKTIDADISNQSGCLVSAIVSTCNSEKFIRGCLENLEAQTIADQLEIIVVNSGSNENEEAIVKAFQEKYSNIKYLKTNKRETVYSAWNRAIKVSSGKYITTANTDDRHRKDALERMARVLDMRPDITLVYADVIITETENETFEACTPVGKYQWYEWNRDTLLKKGCFIGPQPMWRKRVHHVYGYFDETFVSSGDYEFWLRISQTNKFFHIKMPLGLYLKRTDSIEHKHDDLKQKEDQKITCFYAGEKDQKDISCAELSVH